ncbi:MAG: RNA polymerase factor sigma-54 [Spirochaetia bacterium]
MQFQRPELVQQQKLKMSPQMYQSIQIMAMPIMDLRFRIQEELERNPALEVVDEKGPLSLEDIPDRQPQDDYEVFENTSDPGYTKVSNSYDEDSKRNFLEGAFSRPESLRDHLLWQLRLQPIDEQLFAIGETLISNLDENGFHLEDPFTIYKSDKHDKVGRVLDIIQSFDPPGVGVGNHQESLIVQANLNPGAPPLAVEILEKCFDLLEKGRFTDIAKKLKTEEAEVQKAIDFIRTLNPYPGSDYSLDTARYVVPDISIVYKEGNFVIILNDEEIPELGIDPFFSSLEKENKEKRIQSFVKGNVRNAHWFIRSIQQRNATLVRTTKVLLEFQRDFFLKGPKYLKPLTLKDVAKEVDVHEATISRITNGKYAQTEWGIFELKYFFSNSISGTGSSGSRYSKEAVKQIIKEIIEAEGLEKHLSDQKISNILKKRGINIARRTVSKYRKELDIMSSFRR